MAVTSTQSNVSEQYDFSYVDWSVLSSETALQSLSVHFGILENITLLPTATWMTGEPNTSLDRANVSVSVPFSF